MEALTTRDRLAIWSVAFALFFAAPLLDLLTGGVR